MIKWIIFLIYIFVTIYLAYLGNKKTQSLSSYAVGDRKMNPWIVAFALAASMTSTATFIINPGIVYAFGLSAIMGYGVAAGLGLFSGIIILSKGFRKAGWRSQSLTVPQWIGERFQDQRFTVFFALVNLLLIAMVVLISYGSAMLIDFTLGIHNIFPDYHFEITLLFVILFVFTYTSFGGTFAHAYTNTIQGGIMFTVAIVLVISGIPYFKAGLFNALSAENPVLTEIINPQSLFFRNFFEVFLANFIVGFALAVQPHFLIKAVYVKDKRDVNKYLTIAVLMGFIFSLVLLVGLFARVKFGPQYMANVDQVASIYILQSFSPVIGVFISIAILAAAMSTLDGILVALSAIIANDLYLVLARKHLKDKSSEQRLSQALRVGRFSMIGLAGLTLVLSLLQHYFKEFSVAVFAQTWVYALFNATFIPLLFGMFSKAMNKQWILAASLLSIMTHIVFRYGEFSILTTADYINPGLTSAYGIIVGLLVMGLYYLIRLFKTNHLATEQG
ncbi:MAG: sodium:solute symporter family protein [Candidatus Marinimicrobia bacterium]|jgi:sodium/pantothenate symporter|nr:sodium:solute symporter family protein [Candidatus Neomarinimicrobiota bacterium]MBT4360649.1 sodium:solute symporter family protein [Candidatus Neomarinimicrobiota bacterium]MBT4715933.1 sodium:solute symporter family protein [Candidatus Neomarinimicrobiota bacterium]MBT4948134.1 sodium:solute symporter family protein [Candidatus Neomarinimicrobiota bacterium]MBT5271016.1 sodium:solute symporter family protein [Candidatus Neomarinimicrobiota bacterium]